MSADYAGKTLTDPKKLYLSNLALKLDRAVQAGKLSKVALEGGLEVCVTVSRGVPGYVDPEELTVAEGAYVDRFLRDLWLSLYLYP